MACGRLLPQVVSLMMFVIRVVVFVAVKPFMLQLDGAVADIKGFAHGLRHLSKDMLTVGCTFGNNNMNAQHILSTGDRPNVQVVNSNNPWHAQYGLFDFLHLNTARYPFQ